MNDTPVFQQPTGDEFAHINHADQYGHLPPLPVAEAAEAELKAMTEEERRSALRHAEETVPLSVQELIGQRTSDDNPTLREEVLLNCQGDARLASLLLDKQMWKNRLTEKEVNKQMIGSELKIVELNIKSRQAELVRLRERSGPS